MKIAKQAGEAVVNTINAALYTHLDICHKWKFNKLVKAKKKPKEDKYMIRVETIVEMDDKKTNSITGIFDGWVAKNKQGGFDIKLKEVSRQDRYGPSSGCILERAFLLKEYCRCKIV